MKFLKRMFKNQTGAAMTEYALLVGLLAIGVMAALIFMREELAAILTTIAITLGMVSP